MTGSGDELVASFGEVLERLALRAEHSAHELGWDQPVTLWDLRFADDTLLEAFARRAPVGVDVIAAGLTMGQVAEIHGHPYEDLIGMRLDDPDVVGAVLVSEGWNYGPASRAQIAAGNQPGFTPTDDPERVEVRMAQLMLRDGTSLLVVRERDSEPFVADADVTGRVTDALARTLGVPSTLTEPEPLSGVLRRAYAYLLAATIASLDEAAIDALAADARASWADITTAEAAEALAALDDPDTVREFITYGMWDEVTSTPPAKLVSHMFGVAVALPGEDLATFLAQAPTFAWPTWEDLRAAVTETGDKFAGWADTAMFADAIGGRSPARDHVETAIAAMRARLADAGLDDIADESASALREAAGLD